MTEHDILRAEVVRLRLALRGLLREVEGGEHHPEACPRCADCDNHGEGGCRRCGGYDCPECECGLVQTQAAISVARAALAGSPVETRLPVDDEAEARFEKLLAKRREKAESWLNQGPEVSGTLAFHTEPVETRRALAERVRERIAQRIEGLPDDAASWQGVADNVVRALDLDALLEEP